MTLFLSYHFNREIPEYETVVQRVAFYLEKQKGIQIYCYAEDTMHIKNLGKILWKQAVYIAEKTKDYTVAFYNGEWGVTQGDEIKACFTSESAHTIPPNLRSNKPLYSLST
ncbi:MAG: hypothetical protein JXB88_19725 [Spirochaetales bacterium]|nr:hypothetical protein [Spirochaetales bacterium]